MTIKVEVNLDEFYSEDSQASFSEEIQHHIAATVKRELYEDWRKKISEAWLAELKAATIAKSHTLIDSVVAELVEEKAVVESYEVGEFISIRERIIEFFDQYTSIGNTIDSRIKNAVENESKEIVKTLQKRYDMQFAVLIIDNLQKAGFLKPGVAETLLTDKGE